MKNSVKLLATSGLVVMSMGLVGCQNAAAPAPEKAPEVVLQEGMTNLMELSSYKYMVSLVGDLTGPTGELPEKITFDFKMDGSAETKDPMKPKFTLAFVGDVTADEEGGNGEFEVRLNEDTLFLTLKSLEGKGSMAVPEEFVGEVVGKWWKYTIPAEVMEELANSMPTTGEEELTEEQKEIKALMEKTQFFKDVEFKGMANVGGEQSYHYTGTLDEEATVDFIAAVAELQGETVSASEKEDILASMALFDLAGDMYVGKDSGVLNKVTGVMTFDPQGGETPGGTVTYEMELSELNKAVTVEEPADAEEIPAEALGMYL